MFESGLGCNSFELKTKSASMIGVFLHSSLVGIVILSKLVNSGKCKHIFLLLCVFKKVCQIWFQSNFHFTSRSKYWSQPTSRNLFQLGPRLQYQFWYYSGPSSQGMAQPVALDYWSRLLWQRNSSSRCGEKWQPVSKVTSDQMIVVF